MEMVRMSSDLRLKKDVELSQAAYLKFHSVFNTSVSGARPRGLEENAAPCSRASASRIYSAQTWLFQGGKECLP